MAPRSLEEPEVETSPTWRPRGRTVWPACGAESRARPAPSPRSGRPGGAHHAAQARGDGDASRTGCGIEHERTTAALKACRVGGVRLRARPGAGRVGRGRAG